MPSRTPSPAFPRLVATAVLLLPLLLAGGRRQGTAQVSPTATPTPTETPTPTPVIFVAIPGSEVLYGVTNGSRYDASNVVRTSDGSLWAASAPENSIVQLSPDRTQFTRWTMPLDAAPSSLLPTADGKFWITELGGFNVSLFDPAAAQLKRWGDLARRPTALVQRPDGKFWLPETSGSLALFDADTATFTYFTSPRIYSLSYPWLDPDGSLWACDFLVPGIVRFSPDGTTATRWEIDYSFSQPSKIIRGPDGAMWVTLFSAGVVGRFQPSTATFDTWAAQTDIFPYSITPYRGRILFSEELSGYISLLDPDALPIYRTSILNRTDDIAMTVSVNVTGTAIENVVSEVLDVQTLGTTPVAGSALVGLSLYPAGIGPVWGLSVDEERGRIYYATSGNVGVLGPPMAVGDFDLVPAAASADGAAGSSWKTQVTFWNRGLPDSTGTKPSLDVLTNLLPSGWIVGFAPGNNRTIGPEQTDTVADLLKETMGVSGVGALRMAPSPALAQLGTWARTYVTREDGGTYGFSWNAQRAAAGVGAGETGFLFSPPDALTTRTNAGFLVVEDALLTVSAVDTSGKVLASKSFDYPSGYHWQGSTIFRALGIDPSPSARIVFAVTKGRVLPFGNSIDSATNDPQLLETLKPGAASTLQWLTGVSRGDGPAGPSTVTDVQLFNPGADGSPAASVELVFRAAVPAASTVPAPPPVSKKVSVPAGATVVVADALGSLHGVSSGVGEIDVVSDRPVNAFARVTAAVSAQGSANRIGFGRAAIGGGDGLSPTSKGDFIAAADSGYDVTRSDLHLTNPLDVPQTVTVAATTSAGIASGSTTVTMAPKETRVLEGAWYAIAGFGTTSGRLTVTVTNGNGPVLATLLRSDRKTLDVDALAPLVTPVTP